MISAFSRRELLASASRISGERLLESTILSRSLPPPCAFLGPGDAVVRFKSTARQHQDDSKAADRPSTSWERVKNFPNGAKKLYYDLLRYKNIHDASRTKLNAWTIQHPMRGDNIKEPLLWRIYNNEARPGRIPRRQHEQQRRLMQEDLRIMLPLLLVWALPLIGYLPMILVIFCPRQVLTRQFLNDRDIEDYAKIEYRQCREQYSKLAKYFWGSVMTNAHTILRIEKQGEDAAGPIFDAKILYQPFTARHLVQEYAVRLSAGALVSISSYPRDHVVTLALAAGVNQNWPSEIAIPLTRLCPTRWIRQEILRKATDIVDDDELLLEEGHDLNGCEMLTDLEVLDACLNRGLPLNVSYAEMRRCLTHHLRMIGEITSEFPDEAETEGFKLFTLHLAPLRQHLKTVHVD